MKPPDCPLTQTQLEVVRSLAQGKSHEEIAAERGVSPSTVSNHIYCAYNRLGLRRRNGPNRNIALLLVMTAIRRGWLNECLPPHHSYERVLLHRIAAATEAIAENLTNDKLPSVQQEYVDAFIRLVRAKNAPAYHQARAEMVSALGPLVGDRQFTRRVRYDNPFMTELFAILAPPDLRLQTPQTQTEGRKKRTCS